MPHRRRTGGRSNKRNRKRREGHDWRSTGRWRGWGFRGEVLQCWGDLKMGLTNKTWGCNGISWDTIVTWDLGNGSKFWPMSPMSSFIQRVLWFVCWNGHPVAQWLKRRVIIGLLDVFRSGQFTSNNCDSATVCHIANWNIHIYIHWTQPQ